MPVAERKPLLAFEGYLDQINPADGTGATLADTYAYQGIVPSEASSSTPPTSPSGTFPSNPPSRSMR